MSVTRADVRHVAALARLDPAEPDIERLVRELNSILEHVETLRALDAAGEPPAFRLADAAPQRADAHASDTLHGGLDSLSVHRTDGFFTVPRLAALDADAEGDAP